MYENIDSASAEGRFPFAQEPGRHVVALVGWKGRKTRANGDADFVDWKVLKTDNPNLPVGSHRTRMRVLGREGNAFSEVKQRALVAANSRGLPMQEYAITGEFMQKVVANDGGVLKGAVIVVEISTPIKTKAGKDFSPANYFVPTKADLEGLTLE